MYMLMSYTTTVGERNYVRLFFHDDVMTYIELLSALQDLCEGNPLATIGFSPQRATNAVFFFFVVSLNKLLNKQ